MAKSKYKLTPYVPPKSGPATWLRGYLAAYFRDADFFVDSADNQFGRRQAVHEFPNRDEPYVEDLGRKARVFTLSAYIVGDNYYDARNKLIAACEVGGVGTFGHPYLGEFTAVCLSCTMSERTNEGRVARFNLTFQEQTQILITDSVRSSTKQIAVAKENYIKEITDWLDEVYDVAQKPAEFLQEINNAVDEGLSILIAVKKVVGSISDFQRQIQNFIGKGLQAYLDTAQLANDLGSIIDFGAYVPNIEVPGDAALNSLNNPEISELQYKEYTALTAKVPVGTNEGSINGPSGTPDSLNPMAKNVLKFMGGYAVASAVGLYSNIEFESKQDAELLAKAILENMDSLENDEQSSDGLISSVRDLRFAFLNDKDIRTANLGEVYTYSVLDDGIPPLVISNTLYGNIDKENEIINRNKVTNPFFANGPSLTVVLKNGDNR